MFHMKRFVPHGLLCGSWRRCVCGEVQGLQDGVLHAGLRESAQAEAEDVSGLPCEADARTEEAECSFAGAGSEAGLGMVGEVMGYLCKHDGWEKVRAMTTCGNRRTGESALCLNCEGILYRIFNAKFCSLCGGTFISLQSVLWVHGGCGLQSCRWIGNKWANAMPYVGQRHRPGRWRPR